MNILLTGGSRGLGLAIVKSLVAKGETLFVVNRSLSDELADLLKVFPSQVRFVEFDLRRIDDIKSSIFTRFHKEGIPIHGFVNNAAFAYDDLVSNLDANALGSMFQLNVFAPMVLTKYVIRNMLLHKTAGSIIHISSISSRKGYKGLSMYAATKGAMESFSLSTAREWGKLGIRSNCIVPGFMETEMSSKLSEEQRTRVFERTSLGVPTDMQAVSGMTEYLLSDRSRSVTGQAFVVDSGSL